MKSCPKCGKELPDNAIFCASCGAKVEVETEKCPKCGESIPSGAIFCPKCGINIADPTNNPDHREGAAPEADKGQDEDAFATVSSTDDSVTVTFDKKKTRTQVSDFLAGVVGLVILALILYHRWFIPSLAPKMLWKKELLDEAFSQVYDYVESVGGTNIDLDEKSLNITYEKNDKDSINKEYEAFASEITGLDLNKTQYYYCITARWTVDLPNRPKQTINTTTHLICHPEFFKDYPYFSYSEHSTSPAIEQLAAEAESEDFLSTFQLDSYVVLESTDYNSKTGFYIAIYYTWTNTYTTPHAPAFEFDIRAYQEGEELDFDNYALMEAENMMEEIQPGESFSSFYPFELNDLTTPVDIEAGPYSLLDDKVYISCQATIE